MDVATDSVRAFATAAIVLRAPNKRLKLAARVDCGMSLFSARRSLSALR